MSNQTYIPISGKLTPQTTDGVILDSFYVKDGFIVVNDSSEFNRLLQVYTDRNLTAKVYNISDNKTYLYQDGSFTEDPELVDLKNYIDDKDSSLYNYIDTESSRAQEAESELSDRIKFIEDDYLDSSDKEELQSEINLKANKSYVDNNFLNKTTDQDQLIQSNVIIAGDLTVEGTEHITDVETIESQSNLVIVNSNNIPLLAVGGAGIIARTGNQDDSAEAYAVSYYDAIKDSVVLGLGHYSDDSSIGKTFSLTEGQSIATRADSSQMVDENIPEWDAEHYTFVDSGKKVSDFIVANDFNLENGTGTYSLVQKETSAHQGQATGKGSIVFGGFRGDKPNDSPNPIPNDDAIEIDLDQDEYNDTIPLVAGIQSAVFGAGNRAYGDWNFIVGKDSKTTSRGSFAFGGKNYVGDPSNPNKYLWSMAVGSLNVISSDYSFAAGGKNHLSSSYSIGLGYDNTLRSASAKALGNGNLIARGAAYSIVVGNGLLINQPLQTALGNYNKPVDANTLLVLGNGTADNARSNAMTVNKDGKVDVQQLSIHKPLIIYGGDSATVAKIILDQSRSGQITDSGTHTLFGFTSDGATDLKVGHSSYTLNLRGSGSLTYNGDKFEVTNTGVVRALGTPVGDNDLTPKRYVDTADMLKVDKTVTIAGIDLQDNITKSELLSALNVADGAQVNVLDGVKDSNGNDLTITNKKVQLSKSAVGLGNVVNTGDSATPVSGGTTKFTTGGAFIELAKKVDKTTTIAGIALSGNISAQSLTDALIYMNTTTDLDYVMGE